MVYLYAAAAIAFAAALGWGTYERWQAQRYEAMYGAEQERVKALGVEISTQNAAVDALKVAGEQRQKQASLALAAAQAGAGAAQAEAARVRALLASASAQRGPSKGCPPSGADMAVAKLRQGLK